VPRASAPAQTDPHAAPLAPVLLRAPRVAVPGSVAQRARELGVVRSAHHAAAQLLYARDGLDVALHGSTLNVLAGETHVDVVAEDAVAEHLAELVLGVHEALHGSLANPPCGVENVNLCTRVAVDAVYEHTQGVLSCGRATRRWDQETFQRCILQHICFMLRTVLLMG